MIPIDTSLVALVKHLSHADGILIQSNTDDLIPVEQVNPFLQVVQMSLPDSRIFERPEMEVQVPYWRGEINRGNWVKESSGFLL